MDACGCMARTHIHHRLDLELLHFRRRVKVLFDDLPAVNVLYARLLEDLGRVGVAGREVAGGHARLQAPRHLAEERRVVGDLHNGEVGVGRVDPRFAEHLVGVLLGALQLELRLELLEADAKREALDVRRVHFGDRVVRRALVRVERQLRREDLLRARIHLAAALLFCFGRLLSAVGGGGGEGAVALAGAGGGLGGALLLGAAVLHVHEDLAAHRRLEEARLHENRTQVFCPLGAVVWPADALVGVARVFADDLVVQARDRCVALGAGQARVAPEGVVIGQQVAQGLDADPGKAWLGVLPVRNRVECVLPVRVLDAHEAGVGLHAAWLGGRVREMQLGAAQARRWSDAEKFCTRQSVALLVESRPAGSSLSRGKLLYFVFKVRNCNAGE